MKNKFYLLIVLFCLPVLAFSQHSGTAANINGTVLDSLQNEPIEMATIALFNVKDSSLVHGVASNLSGYFELKKIKPASYYLVISFVGYNPKYVNLPEQKFTGEVIRLGKINLNNSGITLSSVEITAELPELVVKEDTLEYNASAFRMQESAVVEDLIKRLPGMEVDTEGKITTATGKQVKRVFVDGKEFFGNDPKMATKNLTVDIVDKVQVVEKKSDLAILTGVEDDDPETIINITIKKGMKKGWMGNVTGGAGTLIDNSLNESARYTGSTLVNRFTEQDQFSFVANANNINNQGSTDRGNTVRSGRGRSGGAGNGITSSNTFGLNTANILNDKLKMGGNLTYNYSDNYSNSNSFRQNLFKDSVSYRRNSLSDREYSNNISFDGKLEYRPDSATTVIFTPSLSYNWSSSNSQSSQVTLAGDVDSTLVNSSESANALKSNGLNLRMQLDLSRKLSAEGRRVSFSTWFNINNSEGDGTNNSKNIFYRNPSKDKILDQQSKTIGDRNSYNLRLTYVEPLGKGNFINFSYNVQVNNTENERQTFDYNAVDDTYTILNPDYSKSSKTQTTNHNIRANFNSNKDKYSYNIGINITPTHIKSKSFVKGWFGIGNDSILNDPPARNAINYAPQLDFTYRFGNDRFVRKNMKFKYSGRTNQPSVTQLDPTPNNTNPLNIRRGNPDLLPSFNNNISLEYNHYNRNSQRSFTTTISHTFTQNEIVNFTTFDTEDKTGIQHTMPINENGSWNSMANALFATPLDGKKRFKFSSRSNFRYRNQVGYSMVDKQSEKNISKTTDLTETLGLSYSNDWFYGQIRGTMKYSVSNYSLEGIQRKESYNYQLSYNTQITLPQSWSVASDINYSGNTGLSSGYNKNEVIWNGELNKLIFKRKNGSLRLQVTDILEQRLNINRSVASNYVLDTEYTALTSYVMFSFAYRFNNIGGNKRGNRGRHENMENEYPSSELQNREDRVRPSGGYGDGSGRRGR